MDVVISISRSLQFPSDLLFGEISRVLKPGGTVLICKSLQSVAEETDKVNLVVLLTWWSLLLNQVSHCGVSAGNTYSWAQVAVGRFSRNTRSPIESCWTIWSCSIIWGEFNLYAAIAIYLKALFPISLIFQGFAKCCCNLHFQPFAMDWIPYF